MIVESRFPPLPWLKNRHLQTIAAASFRPSPSLRYRVERLELPDGDFVDLAWTDHEREAGTPIVVILHGLTGSIESKYARGLMNAVHALGWRAVMMMFRGQSGELNRLPRGYHSGDTGDFDYLVRELKRREPHTLLAAVGYSLGGNVLLKWLGEQGANASLQTAVAVSVPFDLALCARAIRRGFSRAYQARLLRMMRRAVRVKFRWMTMPIPLPNLRKLNDFTAFDDAITAPLHGFRNVQHYYDECSSKRYLKRIRIPTLIIHAEDDPFMTPAVVPKPNALSNKVTLELSAHGGHVGFIAARPSGRPYFWLEERIPAHLREYLPVADSLSPALAGAG